MFFFKSYISSLKEEIRYLRSINKELLKIIVAVSGKDINYNQIKQLEKNVNPFDAINKNIEDIVAETEDEKKQKALAKKQLEELLTQ